ncbi:MAG: hypothetical protein IPI43_11155 [Sandaracinaceae bacterium]|nr:hypothetical protein [Sandaracinaceae bacterium]
MAERALGERRDALRGHCGPILARLSQLQLGQGPRHGLPHAQLGRLQRRDLRGLRRPNPDCCFTHETSPSSLECDDPDEGAEANPDIQVCQ